MMLSLRSFIIVLTMTSTLFADGFIMFPPPYLTPLSVRYHKVTCDIIDGVATTTVDQEFVNNQTDAFIGGRYVFPVPKGALIDQFRVIIDGEARNTTLMSKDTARAFFTDAMKKSDQASLLEYTDNSAYIVEIGTVGPGTSRRLQISYVEVLPKTDGLSRYLYPLNTEKYSMQLIDTVMITVNIKNTSPITSVYAPSFPVTIQRTDQNTVTAVYSSFRSRPSRDFDLFYKLSDDNISFHLFTYKKAEEDGYFLMLITPKLVKPEEGDEAVAKDIVFTIDRSGSMAGTKIVQARDALRFCINRLLPDDYFNIVAFQTTVSSNTDMVLPALAENVAASRSFVEAITASGGTNICGALTTTLSYITANDRPHYCIFLTDGQATAGVVDIGTISAMVNAANTNGTRIFSVGFGYDVNTVLIDKISIDNGGFPLYCSPDQNIEEVISDLYKRIEAPVMTSPVLSINAEAGCYGISPEKMTDLFSGSEFAIYGRYTSAATGTVLLAGNTGDKIDTLRYDVSFPEAADEYAFIPRLWATQQISRLLSKIKLQALTSDDIAPLRDSVVMLSKEYGIVTPYTASVFVSSGTGSTAWAADLQVASGGKANEASNFMQGMQQNSNAAQTVVADTNALPYTVAPQLNQMQNAGNKLFVYKNDSIWYDAAFDSTAACDTVYYGSATYFDLANSDAQLRNFLAVGNQAAFSYNGKNYRVLDNGVAAAALPRSVQTGMTHQGQLLFRQDVTGIVFSRAGSDHEGGIEIYAVNGCRVASLSFERGCASVAWHNAENGRVLPGTYITVYRSAGERRIMKVMINR